MKKYMMILMTSSLLHGIPIDAELSSKQEAELRRAMMDYKKASNPKDRAGYQKTIDKYAQEYPNDPLVKAKLNEKMRFDQGMQTPNGPVDAKLSSKQEAELRRVMMDYKKASDQKDRAEYQKTIDRYAQEYPNDPLVKAKLNEKVRFDKEMQKPNGPVDTKLSSEEEAELRKAVMDYKKAPNQKDRAGYQKTIDKYEQKYPNDPLVKAKLNEKIRFDYGIQKPNAPVAKRAKRMQPVKPLPDISITQ